MENVANITPSSDDSYEESPPQRSGAPKPVMAWGGLSPVRACECSHLDVVVSGAGAAVTVQQPEGAARPQRPPEVTSELVLVVE